jgi:hypothetical protein
MLYFESTRRDKSNNIPYANICIYILVEKYGQMNSILDQNQVIYFETKKVNINF